MAAPEVSPLPKCRYCKVRFDAHDGADHVFVTYAAKTKAASNSFVKTEIDVVREMFRCAVTGQPLSAGYVRSKYFASAMRKFNKMNDAIETALKLNKIGENKDDQSKVA